MNAIAPVPSRAFAWARPAVGLLDLAGATIAGTLIPVSLIWDFSWESSVGVDRVWSPPHLATHVAVWLSAIIGLRLLLTFTLARRRGETPAGVNLGPLCAPVGAWVLLWAAMLFEVVFPLDVWWQKAYGLAAGLWPPPQILKALSFFAIQSGTLLLMGTAKNPAKARACWINWNCGMMLALVAVMLGTGALTNAQHGASFYTLCAIVLPGPLALAAAGPGRWNATFAALGYTGLGAVLVWLLPLFPAQPLTPPIHNPMTHMMPPQFPFLIVLPALGIDLAKRWLGREMRWRRGIFFGLAVGLVFAGGFALGQWHFAGFLLSPAADNWFFAGGGRHWPYFLKIDDARSVFWLGPHDVVNGSSFLLTVAFATGAAWLGLLAGKLVNALRR